MTDLSENSRDGDEADIEIRVTFRRRVMNQMLTAFLPSFCICLISFSTNYYHQALPIFR